MGKVYLFSPVGNTDPIRYFYDGSMLHICRVYEPDVVVLYLSKEMVMNQRKDQRYTRTLKLLSEKMSHPFEIRLIEKTGLSEVQQYDYFYQEFTEIIRKLEEEMEEEDRLLLNMASGTPAMKSALIVMATLAEYRFTPVQVSTPKKKSNLEFEERDEYDVEVNWELDEDNKDRFVNRCEEVRCLKLVRLLKINMIEKHILAYDYHAAMAISRELQREISPVVCNFLGAADARLNLDWDTVCRKIPQYKEKFCFVKEDKNRKLFEYALGLEIKVKKGEYADFVRAITPLGVDLLEHVLRLCCGIEINNYCTMDKKGKKWDKTKLAGTEVKKYLEDAYKPQFKGKEVYSHHLNAIIQRTCKNRRLAEKVREYIEIEQNIRNVAAHEIISVTDAWIIRRTKKSAAEIMQLIKYLCEAVKINTVEKNWNSYNVMNSLLIELLEKEK